MTTASISIHTRVEDEFTIYATPVPGLGLAHPLTKGPHAHAIQVQAISQIHRRICRVFPASLRLIRICDLGNPHFLFTLHCIASLPIPPHLLSSYLSSIMLRNATQMSIMIMKPMHICFVFGSELQCIVLSWVRLIPSVDSINFT